MWAGCYHYYCFVGARHEQSCGSSGSSPAESWPGFTHNALLSLVIQGQENPGEVEAQ